MSDPLLLEDALARALEACLSLAAVEQREAHTLSHGSAGVGYFLARYAQLTGDPRAADRALMAGEHAVRAAHGRPVVASLFKGAAGLSLLAEEIEQGPVSEADPIDAAMAEALVIGGGGEPIGLIEGLGGVLVALAGRAERDPAKQLIERVLENLNAAATRDEAGIRWTEPRHDRGSFTGLAYGVAGLVSGLAEVARVAPSCGALPLLAETAKQLQAYTSLCVSRETRVPSFVGGECRWSNFPNAWCHGDLGIAIALARAGNVLHEPTFLSEASRVASSYRGRLCSGEHVRGAGLCHGWGGIALLWLALFEQLGEPSYEAEAWSAAAAVAEATRDDQALLANATLLTGAPGIGIALLPFVMGCTTGRAGAYVLGLSGVEERFV